MGKCRKGTNGYYKCGQEGHFQRDCLRWAGKAQSFLPVPPIQENQRGATSSTSGATNHLNVMSTRQEQEDSPDIVTGMIRFFTLDCYVRMNSGATLSFVSPDVGCKFDRTPESLLEPFIVSTHIGELVLAERVYRSVMYSSKSSSMKYLVSKRD